MELVKVKCESFAKSLERALKMSIEERLETIEYPGAIFTWTVPVAASSSASPGRRVSPSCAAPVGPIWTFSVLPSGGSPWPRHPPAPPGSCPGCADGPSTCSSYFGPANQTFRYQIVQAGVKLHEVRTEEVNQSQKNSENGNSRKKILLSSGNGRLSQEKIKCVVVWQYGVTTQVNITRWFLEWNEMLETKQDRKLFQWSKESFSEIVFQFI